MRFEDKVALISGAGAGIGRATATIIGREGGTVVAVDLDQGALDSWPRDRPPRAVTVRADALDAGAVEDVVRRAVDTHGRIDILVNAVGGSTIISPARTPLLDELTLEEWQKLIHFNLTGTFLFSHAVTPVMKRQESGKIVNLSSIAGRGLSRASSTAYATAKGGIIALTRKLSLELGPHGITVNAIAPSLTLSERIRPHWERRRRGSRRDRAHSRFVGWRTPKTRLGSSASWPLPTPTSSPASPSTSPASSALGILPALVAVTVVAVGIVWMRVSSITVRPARRRAVPVLVLVTFRQK